MGGAILRNLLLLNQSSSESSTVSSNLGDFGPVGPESVEDCVDLEASPEPEDV